MIGGRRPIAGPRSPRTGASASSDRTRPYFRYTGPGQLVAKAAAPRRRPPSGRALGARSAAVAIGRPLASEEEVGERLSKKKALAIFSSDAISSSAYATEEILRVLVVAGAAALVLSLQVAIAIAVLLAVVVDLATARSAGPTRPAAAPTRSPKENLAPIARARRGGGAPDRLRDDGRRLDRRRRSSQIFSVVPGPRRDRGSRSASSSIVLITVANLRGLRESGNIFAIPTYLFVGLALLMVGDRPRSTSSTGQAHPIAPQPNAVPSDRRQPLGSSCS